MVGDNFLEIIDSDDELLLAEEKSSDTVQIENLPGFDNEAGRLWIYPTNYPIRAYQKHITEAALYQNTLVALPTGLGKTFIAAVLMYNIYRWYPQGIVVFLAPTRPLVIQQVNACFSIMGLPQEDTALIMGTVVASKRQQLYDHCRVFYMTPQTFANDLENGRLPRQRVKCIVFDEAHRAVGNYAYCEIIREMADLSNNFRVLALSATPGKNIQTVKEVMANLLISRIQLRTDESPDVVAYTHCKHIETVVVSPSESMLRVKTMYVKVYEVILERLRKRRLLKESENSTNLSKFKLLRLRENFRCNAEQLGLSGIKAYIEGDFMISISLQHGLDLLQLHGLRIFHSYISSIIDGDKGNSMTRMILKQSEHMMNILSELNEKFTPLRGVLASSQIAEFSHTNQCGHPKLEKLREIVLSHFKAKKTKEQLEVSRVIIFVDYRDSVSEIVEILSAFQPLIKVKSFVGQSALNKKPGVKVFTQKKQIEVMSMFRQGICNTLVSTCVGEEGLDIGEVDLIICFDAHASPIRMVQRIGRAGRKKEGRIVMLLCKGKEEKTYADCLANKQRVDKAIFKQCQELSMFNGRNRLVPKHLKPEYSPKFIEIPQLIKLPPKKSPKSSASKTGLDNLTSAMTRKDESPYLDASEYKECVDIYGYKDQAPGAQTVLWAKYRMMCLDKDFDYSTFHADANTIWQTGLQNSTVGHSLQTEQLVAHMRYIELIGIKSNCEIKQDQDNLLKHLKMSDIFQQTSMQVFLKKDKIAEKKSRKKSIQKLPIALDQIIDIDSESNGSTVHGIVASQANEGDLAQDKQEVPTDFNSAIDYRNIFIGVGALNSSEDESESISRFADFPSPPGGDCAEMNFDYESELNSVGDFDYVMSLWDADHNNNSTTNKERIRGGRNVGREKDEEYTTGGNESIDGEEGRAARKEGDEGDMILQKVGDGLVKGKYNDMQFDATFDDYITGTQNTMPRADFNGFDEGIADVFGVTSLEFPGEADEKQSEPLSEWGNNEQDLQGVGGNNVKCMQKNKEPDTCRGFEEVESRSCHGNASKPSSEDTLSDAITVQSYDAITFGDDTTIPKRAVPLKPVTTGTDDPITVIDIVTPIKVSTASIERIKPSNDISMLAKDDAIAVSDDVITPLNCRPCPIMTSTVDRVQSPQRPSLELDVDLDCDLSRIVTMAKDCTIPTLQLSCASAFDISMSVADNDSRLPKTFKLEIDDEDEESEDEMDKTPQKTIIVERKSSDISANMEKCKHFSQEIKAPGSPPRVHNSEINLQFSDDSFSSMDVLTPQPVDNHSSATYSRYPQNTASFDLFSGGDTTAPLEEVGGGDGAVARVDTIAGDSKGGCNDSIMVNAPQQQVSGNFELSAWSDEDEEDGEFQPNDEEKEKRCENEASRIDDNVDYNERLGRGNGDAEVEREMLQFKMKQESILSPRLKSQCTNDSSSFLTYSQAYKAIWNTNTPSKLLDTVGQKVTQVTPSSPSSGRSRQAIGGSTRKRLCVRPRVLPRVLPRELPRELPEHSDDSEEIMSGQTMLSQRVGDSTNYHPQHRAPYVSDDDDDIANFLARDDCVYGKLKSPNRDNINTAARSSSRGCDDVDDIAITRNPSGDDQPTGEDGSPVFPSRMSQRSYRDDLPTPLRKKQKKIDIIDETVCGPKTSTPVSKNKPQLSNYNTPINKDESFQISIPCLRDRLKLSAKSTCVPKQLLRYNSPPISLLSPVSICLPSSPRSRKLRPSVKRNFLNFTDQSENSPSPIKKNQKINKFESSSDEEFQNNRRPFSTRIANKKVKFPSSVATTSKPMTSIQRNSKNIRVKPSRARPIQKCPEPVARRTVKSSHQQIKELNICNFAECEAELSGSDSFDDLEDSDMDCLEGSFINDNTQFTQIVPRKKNNDSKFIYMKSMKAHFDDIPHNKEKNKKGWNHKDIFSQAVISQDSYEQDSFCIDSGDEFVETIHSSKSDCTFSPKKFLNNSDDLNSSRDAREDAILRKTQRNRRHIMSSSDDDH